MFEVERDGERGVCKRLTSRGRESAEARESLAREGAIGERIFRGGSAAVAEVLAHGDDAGGPFLVTRFVEGSTLRQVDPGAVDLAFVRHVFAALGEVNRAGVVHGDVHLDNVIVANDGRVVVLDFGLAAAPLSSSSAFRGTAMYAAPEAARGEALDASSDRFSLAAALMHLASGAAPRNGTNAAALLYEAGTAPLDDFLAHPALSRSPALAELTRVLAPFLCFDRDARPSDSP